jgi:hypothetical protein
MIPTLRHLARRRDVIHHQHQPVVMIAILHLNVDASLGHAPSQLPQLPHLSLPQALQHHVADFHNANPRRFQGPPRSFAVFEQKVRDASAID